MAKRHNADGRPTIAQIAQIAGVSVPTVSKVLNDRADVALPTRKRVERVIEEYGFVRNRAARALRKGKTGLVDLILPRLDDEYYLPILEGVAQVLREAGVRLVLTSTNYQPEQEVQWIDTVTDHSTDGILLVLPSDEAIEHLERSGLPFVLIHNQRSPRSGIPSVTITSWEGGFVATTHLISLGHRRIAYIGKTAQARDAIERIAGYRAALDAANLPLDPQLQPRAARELLGHAAHDRPRDRASAAVQLEIGERGLGVGDAAVACLANGGERLRREPVGPQVRRHAPDRAGDLGRLAGVEGEADEAEARVAHAAVEIEFELPRERVGPGSCEPGGHHLSKPGRL